MNKLKFEQLAKQVGANKCIDFDYSYTKKDCCAKDYVSKGIFGPCVLLNGGECKYFKKGFAK